MFIRYFTVLLLLFVSIHGDQCDHTKKVAVIGTGYVGLVTAAGLATLGHHVIGADIDQEKINTLNTGNVPFYEPGLPEILKDAILRGHLTFTTNIADAITKSDIVFIAVGTPMADNGSADLSYVKNAARMIRDNLNGYKIVCIKSTVPVGTHRLVRGILEEKNGADGFAIISNPEFLREGTAMVDVMHPDRIVLGASSRQALDTMKELYQPLISDGIVIVEVDNTTAETIKYASNAFLAVKLSFINEMAQFSDAVGADIEKIAYGMGLDKRIGPHFLKPGPGFGGSCFPKDSNALLYMAGQSDVNLKMVRASLEANQAQRCYVLDKVMNLLDNQARGKKIAVLGLAFKANTDDVRESPAIDIIDWLQEYGADICAYDPMAAENMKKINPTLLYASSLQEALKDADAAIILTEWDEFKNMDLAAAGSLMKNKILIDARNILSLQELQKNGFVFDSIGRSKIR